MKKRISGQGTLKVEKSRDYWVEAFRCHIAKSLGWFGRKDCLGDVAEKILEDVPQENIIQALTWVLSKTKSDPELGETCILSTLKKFFAFKKRGEEEGLLTAIFGENDTLKLFKDILQAVYKVARQEYFTTPGYLIIEDHQALFNTMVLIMANNHKHRFSNFGKLTQSGWDWRVCEIGKRLSLMDVPFEHRSFELCRAAMKANSFERFTEVPVEHRHGDVLMNAAVNPNIMGFETWAEDVELPIEVSVAILKSCKFQHDLPIADTLKEETYYAAAYAFSQITLDDVPEHYINAKFWREVLLEQPELIENVAIEERTLEMLEAVMDSKYGNCSLIDHFPKEMVTEDHWVKNIRKDATNLKRIPIKFKTEKVCMAALNNCKPRKSIPPPPSPVERDSCIGWRMKEEKLYFLMQEGIPWKSFDPAVRHKLMVACVKAGFHFFYVPQDQITSERYTFFIRHNPDIYIDVPRIAKTPKMEEVRQLTYLEMLRKGEINIGDIPYGVFAEDDATTAGLYGHVKWYDDI